MQSKFSVPSQDAPPQYDRSIPKERNQHPPPQNPVLDEFIQQALTLTPMPVPSARVAHGPSRDDA